MSLFYPFFKEKRLMIQDEKSVQSVASDSQIWNDFVQTETAFGLSEEEIKNEYEKRLVAPALYDCALALSEFDRPDVLNAHIQAGNIDINAPTPRTRQPLLFIAITCHRLQSCRLLIEAGADIFHRDMDKGYVFWAVYSNAPLELVEFLLGLSAGPIEPVTEELLHYAKRKSSPQVLALLETYKRDIVL